MPDGRGPSLIRGVGQCPMNGPAVRQVCGAVGGRAQQRVVKPHARTKLDHPGGFCRRQGVDGDTHAGAAGHRSDGGVQARDAGLNSRRPSRRRGPLPASSNILHCETTEMAPGDGVNSVAINADN